MLRNTERILRESGVGAGYLMLAVHSFLYHAGMVVVIAVSTVLAFVCEGQYWPSVFVEVSAGTALFWLLPMALDADLQWGTYFRGPVIVVALILGGVASQFNGVVQSFLIEYSAAIVLLVILEVGVKKWLETLSERSKELAAELERFEQWKKEHLDVDA